MSESLKKLQSTCVFALLFVLCAQTSIASICQSATEFQLSKVEISAFLEGSAEGEVFSRLEELYPDPAKQASVVKVLSRITEPDFLWPIFYARGILNPTRARRPGEELDPEGKPAPEIGKPDGLRSENEATEIMANHGYEIIRIQNIPKHEYSELLDQLQGELRLNTIRSPDIFIFDEQGDIKVFDVYSPLTHRINKLTKGIRRKAGVPRSQGGNDSEKKKNQARRLVVNVIGNKGFNKSSGVQLIEKRLAENPVEVLFEVIVVWGSVEKPKITHVFP